MNETAKDAGDDDKAYARLEKDFTAVKNDIAHLSQQVSEAVNALGAVAPEPGAAHSETRPLQRGFHGFRRFRSGRRDSERRAGRRVFGRRHAGGRDPRADCCHAGFRVGTRLSDRRDLAPVIGRRSSCSNGSPIAGRKMRAALCGCL